MVEARHILYKIICARAVAAAVADDGVRNSVVVVFVGGGHKNPKQTLQSRYLSILLRDRRDAARVEGMEHKLSIS